MTLPEAGMRSWVEVDLGVLVRNAEYVSNLTGTPLIPIVKSDGYGHGAAVVSRALLAWGEQAGRVYAFGVATLNEAITLKEALGESRAHVFCCTPLLPSELTVAHEHSIMPALHRDADIRKWCSLGNKPWQLAVDTGMQRAGVRWDKAGELAAVLQEHQPAGVFTHFHSAELDNGSKEEQERRFTVACSAMSIPSTVPIHLDNSAALVGRVSKPHTLQPAWVRPGLALYGGMPEHTLNVEPIAAVRARIVDLHDVTAGESVSYSGTYVAQSPRTVATLGIGYSDGYRWGLSNRADALLNGHRVPVVGLVTMDMIMVDVTGVHCAVGDVATLIGAEAADEGDGGDSIRPAELAARARLSVYEILVGLQLRMPRLYRNAPGSADEFTL